MHKSVNKYHYNYNKIADCFEYIIANYTVFNNYRRKGDEFEGKNLISNKKPEEIINLPNLIFYYDYLGDININLVLFLEKVAFYCRRITIVTAFDKDYKIIIKWNYWIFERLNKLDSIIWIQRPNGEKITLESLMQFGLPDEDDEGIIELPSQSD